jgi:hypothetical protein
MGNKISLTVHHLVPRSRHGEFPNLNLNDPRNKKDILETVHEAINLIFKNMTPEEMVRLIITDYSPAPEYYSPDDSDMRTVFVKIWNEKREAMKNSPQYACGLCQGKIVAIESGRAGGKYNCQKCHEFECGECRYCKMPARVEIKRVGYVCGVCIAEIAGGRKRVNARHASRIIRWWKKFRKQSDYKQ